MREFQGSPGLDVSGRSLASALGHRKAFEFVSRRSCHPLTSRRLPKRTRCAQPFAEESSGGYDIYRSLCHPRLGRLRMTALSMPHMMISASSVFIFLNIFNMTANLPPSRMITSPVDPRHCRIVSGFMRPRNECSIFVIDRRWWSSLLLCCAVISQWRLIDQRVIPVFRA
jgi:hypothetical protein